MKKGQNHENPKGGAASSKSADLRDVMSEKRKPVFKAKLARFLDRKIASSFPLSKLEKKAGKVATFDREERFFFFEKSVANSGLLAKQMKAKLARAMQKITPG